MVNKEKTLLDYRGCLVRVKDYEGRIVEGIVVKDYNDKDAIFLKVLRESCDYPKTSWSRYGIREKEGTFLLRDNIESINVIAKPQAVVINESRSNRKMERFTVRDGDRNIHFILTESKEGGTYGYFTTSKVDEESSRKAISEAVQWATYNAITEGFHDAKSALTGVSKIGEVGLSE